MWPLYVTLAKRAVVSLEPKLLELRAKRLRDLTLAPTSTTDQPRLWRPPYLRSFDAETCPIFGLFIMLTAQEVSSAPTPHRLRMPRTEPVFSGGFRLAVH